MCLYSRGGENPKYKPNKKNGGIPPIPSRKELRWVSFKCGKCIECRKEKQTSWAIRLMNELKERKGRFTTLTFSEESLDDLEKELGTKEANKIATVAMRRFLENWRSKYGKSVRHWFITELGHKNTQRLHMHGILFTEKEPEEYNKIWIYGHLRDDGVIGGRGITYISKYIMKIDRDHEGFEGKILCSKGIGKNWIESGENWRNRYMGPEETEDNYRTSTGHKVKMPMYYRNYTFTEEEKEALWMAKVDKQETYVGKYKIKMDGSRKAMKEWKKAIEEARRKNIELGYGTSETKTKQFMCRGGKIIEE